MKISVIKLRFMLIVLLFARLMLRNTEVRIVDRGTKTYLLQQINDVQTEIKATLNEE